MAKFAGEMPTMFVFSAFTRIRAVCVAGPVTNQVNPSFCVVACPMVAHPESDGNDRFTWISKTTLLLENPDAAH